MFHCRRRFKVFRNSIITNMHANSVKSNSSGALRNFRVSLPSFRRPNAISQNTLKMISEIPS